MTTCTLTLPGGGLEEEIKVSLDRAGHQWNGIHQFARLDQTTDEWLTWPQLLRRHGRLHPNQMKKVGLTERQEVLAGTPLAVRDAEGRMETLIRQLREEKH